jgi:hypothetical protein
MRLLTAGTHLLFFQQHHYFFYSFDVAIKLANILEIEASLLYDDFSRFLAVPYTEALKSVRTALGLSQKAFA